MLLHLPPSSTDPMPAAFLFKRLKEEINGLFWSQESLKNGYEGVMWTVAKDEFVTIFSLG
jgi:hypothetical protein